MHLIARVTFLSNVLVFVFHLNGTIGLVWQSKNTIKEKCKNYKRYNKLKKRTKDSLSENIVYIVVASHDNGKLHDNL